MPKKLPAGFNAKDQLNNFSATVEMMYDNIRSIEQLIASCDNERAKKHRFLTREEKLKFMREAFGTAITRINSRPEEK